jgi:uncharacterized membrane protein YhaH (DUF805 family)
VPRKYYRKKSSASSMLSDSAAIGRKAPWWFTLIFGITIFVVFYFVIPAWLQAKADSIHSELTRTLLGSLLLRRSHWFQWLGIAIGLICLFYSFRNYVFTKASTSKESKVVVFIARLLGHTIS